MCLVDFGTRSPEPDSSLEARLAEALESELCGAFQYRNARALGQLAAVLVVARRDSRDRHTRHFLARGMRWGDIKPDALIDPVGPDELTELIR